MEDPALVDIFMSTLHVPDFNFAQGLVIGEKHFGCNPAQVKAYFIKLVTDKNLPLVPLEEEHAFVRQDKNHPLFPTDDGLGFAITPELEKLESIKRYLTELKNFVPQACAAIGMPLCGVPEKSTMMKRVYIHMPWQTYWLMRMLICAIRSHPSIIQQDNVNQIVPVFSAAFGSSPIQEAIKASIASGMAEYCQSDDFKMLLAESFAACLKYQVVKKV